MRRTPATPNLATSASKPTTILGDALSPSIRSASVEPFSCISVSGLLFPCAFSPSVMLHILSQQENALDDIRAYCRIAPAGTAGTAAGPNRARDLRRHRR